jgi:O-antigen/teichoic acid export membrane protein
MTGTPFDKSAVGEADVRATSGSGTSGNGASVDATAGDPIAGPRGFLNSVIWNWLGVTVSIVSAFLLSPFIIRRLGDENYGLWALTTSLVEYYWLLDLGLRSATFQFAATFNGKGEQDNINRMINTNLAYSLLLAPLLIGGAWLGVPLLAKFMHITHPLFSKLVLIVVATWALTSLLSVFTTTLEGIERFDVTNVATLAGITARTLGTAILLFTGHGVVAIAWMGMAAQILTHSISYTQVRRIFPFLRIAPRYCSYKMFKDMLRYGMHSVAASMAQRILSQSPPLLIGYYLPTRFVGYYTAPTKLLDFTATTVMRIGNVANSRSALLWAQDKKREVLELAIMVNRYSLAIFLPLSIFLAVYGPQLLAVWISPEFARQSSGVLVALLAGITLGNAAQFSSTSILFGIGKHRMFARAMLVEATVSTAGMALVLPRYGLTAAAVLASAMMVLNRALVTPFILSRELNASYFGYLAGVNLPLIAVVPVGAGLFALRHFVPGANWFQLIGAGAVTVLLYLPISWRFVRHDHRALALAKIREYGGKAGLFAAQP